MRRIITMDSIHFESCLLVSKKKNEEGKVVSIMVPSWDRIPMFIRCIKRIFEHSDQLGDIYLNIIICNDGCAQGLSYLKATEMIIKDSWDSCPNILSIHHLVHTKEKMGIGVARATSTKYMLDCMEQDYMLSLDDDSLIRGEGIVIAVNFLNESKPWVCGISTDAAMFSYNKPDFYPKTTLSGNFSMYKIEALRAVGDWDPNLRSREEFDLCLRLWLMGYECYCTAKIKCGHKRHQDGGLISSGFSDIKLMNSYLVNKYPGLIKETKNGNLIRTKLGKETITQNHELMVATYEK